MDLQIYVRRVCCDVVERCSTTETQEEKKLYIKEYQIAYVCYKIYVWCGVPPIKPKKEPVEKTAFLQQRVAPPPPPRTYYALFRFFMVVVRGVKYEVYSSFFFLEVLSRSWALSHV